MVGWAPMDLGLVGRQLVGIAGQDGFRYILQQVVSEPKVEKFGISPGSHGDGGARERLRKVAQVVCGWRVGLGAW